MKKIFLLINLLYSYLNLNAQTLSGKITDSITSSVLTGVVVYIPQLKLNTTTDADGFFKFDPIPNGSYDIQAQYLGYTTIIKHIDISGSTTFNFTLSPSSTGLQEVIVTAFGNRTTNLRSPMPINVISHEMLLQTAATNAIAAIALEPGVNAISSGPGVSKPEINGLGFNRVLTLFDGERQEDFQWGDEHGVLIDPYAVYNAEIIRGPASLQYGANAEAGVVSFKSEPFAENGTVQGSVLQEYQTNNGLIGTSFDVGGNKNGLVWNLRGSNEEAHCYNNPKDGYVWGTAYTQQNIRGTLGWNKKWGFSRVSFSLLERDIQIPDGNRDSATGAFEFDVPQPIGYRGNPQYYTPANAPSPLLIGTLVPGTGQVFPSRADFLSYNPLKVAGYQKLQHETIWWQNTINLEKGTLGLDIGYSNSNRKEYDTGNYPSLNMSVFDIPYSFKYQLENNYTGIKLTTGINGIYEWCKNNPPASAPYIGNFVIPNYHNFDLGGYAILQKDFKNLTISAGFRYDLRTTVGEPMYIANYATYRQQIIPEGDITAINGTFIANAKQHIVPIGDTVLQHFGNFKRSTGGTSASIGATYQLPEHNYVKLNFAKSFRAPSISELTSNQLDPANIFRLGDANLKPESGYEVDIAFGNNGKDISFEIDGFVNYIQNFIFPTKLGSVLGGDSIQLGAPVYKYGSTTAIIEGITAFFNIHPVDPSWIEIKNGFTYTYSYIPNASDSTSHVPFTPAPRLTTTIKFKLNDQQNSILKGTFIYFGLEHDWAQNDIYSAEWNELPSLSYTLYNMGFGTNFMSKKTKHTIASLFVNCTNLMNLAYVDHTSRPQYFWAYNGTYAGLGNNGVTPAIVTQPSQGIYNMGRNIGIKAIFPFGGHKVSETELHGIE